MAGFSVNEEAFASEKPAMTRSNSTLFFSTSLTLVSVLEEFYQSLHLSIPMKVIE
jgi:hypothetical protein